MAIVTKGGGGGGGGGGGATRGAGDDGESREVFTNLPPRTGPVVGRKPEMQAIAEVFGAAQQEDRSGRVEVVGPLGSGATTVAVELARRAGLRFPGGAWWIRADMGVDLAWADLASARGGGPVTDLAASAQAERARFSADPRALLVIDGIGSAADLERALPPPGSTPADVFVVSREPTGVIEDVVEVSPVPKHAPRRIAHSVLRIRDGKDAALPAVRVLDGLALTASLAARVAVAYGGQGGPLSVDDTVHAIMHLVPLVRQNPASVEIMLLCSVAHPTLISVDSLFTGLATLRDGRAEAPTPDLVGEAVLRLVRLGMLQLDEESRVSMHPGIQSVVRGMTQSEDDLRTMRNALADGLIKEAGRAVTDAGVNVRQASLHQLRSLAADCTGADRERLENATRTVEGALGLGD